MGVCAQFKEQTAVWLSNDMKNTTNLRFWHSESDGEHRRQIKAKHVWSSLWLSSSPCQRASSLGLIHNSAKNTRKKNQSVCALLITPPDLEIRDNHCKTCSLASKDSGWTDLWGLQLFLEPSQKRLGSGSGCLNGPREENQHLVGF